MLKVKKKVFEKVIIQIVKSTDIEELITEFSLHRIFFYSLLKDISKGKDSPNYHVLKEFAQNRQISEQSIVERAKYVLSYLAPDEPKEDYYKILNVSPTASADEIRSRWLSLMKTYRPDKLGERGLDVIKESNKEINEAYRVLGDPIKRSKYNARRLPTLPVVVKSPWTEIISRKFISSIFLSVVIFTVTFYPTESSLLFRSAEKKGEFVEKVENKVEEKSKLPTPNFTLAMEKTSSSKPEGEEKEITSSILKESEKILTTQGGVKTEEISKLREIPNEEAKKETITPPTRMKTEEPKRRGTAQEKIKKERIFAQKQVKAQKGSLQLDTKEDEQTKTSNLFANYKDNRVNVGQIPGISYDVKRAEIIETIRQDVLTSGREEEAKAVEKETEKKEAIIPSTGLDTKGSKVLVGAIAFSSIAMVGDLNSADSDFLFKNNKVAAAIISDKEMKEIRVQGHLIHVSEVLSLEKKGCRTGMRRDRNDKTPTPKF